MTPAPTRRGRCLFQIPPGFEVIEPASVPTDTPFGADGPGMARPPVSVTLARRNSGPEGKPWSEDPADLKPDRYPVTLTLTALSPGRDVGPLDFARRVMDELRPHLKGFTPGFLQPDRIGNLEAARAHFSYDVHFRLDHLLYAWRLDEEIWSASITVRPAEVTASWALLRKFALSVRTNG